MRSDAELLAAHVAGDDEAFGELFARHQDRLWSVAVRITRDPEAAADALQDAMISAFRRASGFRGQAAVTTWLHRIVVNSCLDQLRRARAHPPTELPPTDHHQARQLIAPDDPADAAVAATVRDEVAAALSHLSADQRAALVLVDIEGYSVDQAAAMLGCATGTIKSRCARGRAKLAPLVKDLWAEVT